MLWLSNAPVVGVISFEVPTPQMPVLSLSLLVRLLQPAFVMALLPMIGTLVTALQLQAITGTRNLPNQTIIGVGLGNIAAGVIGGLPGAISVATYANVFSGGRSRVAGILAAAVLLLLVIALRPLASAIPLAVIAGIIIINGWNIIDWRFISCIHRVDRGYALVMLTTACTAMFVDFIFAVLIGLVVSALISARRAEAAEMSRLFSVPILDQVILGVDADDAVDPFEARSGLVMFPERVSAASAREQTQMSVAT